MAVPWPTETTVLVLTRHAHTQTRTHACRARNFGYSQTLLTDLPAAPSASSSLSKNTLQRDPVRVMFVVALAAKWLLAKTLSAEPAVVRPPLPSLQLRRPPPPPPLAQPATPSPPGRSKPGLPRRGPPQRLSLVRPSSTSALQPPISPSPRPPPLVVQHQPCRWASSQQWPS